MKNKIIIEIPDDLTEKEEAELISRKVAKKMLQIANSGSPGKKQARIGNQQFESFKMPTSEIIINRISKDTPPSMMACSCGILFNKKDGSSYWTNYGGKARRVFCCGNECRDIAFEIAGNGRVAIQKSKLTPFRFF